MIVHKQDVICHYDLNQKKAYHGYIKINVGRKIEENKNNW